LWHASLAHLARPALPAIVTFLPFLELGHGEERLAPLSLGDFHNGSDELQQKPLDVEQRGPELNPRAKKVRKRIECNNIHLEVVLVDAAISPNSSRVCSEYTRLHQGERAQGSLAHLVDEIDDEPLDVAAVEVLIGHDHQVTVTERLDGLRRVLGAELEAHNGDDVLELEVRADLGYCELTRV
tara:strand:- start:906 stop:1454 length:549 start_codon:yes stop_codon:yes gene_type:complete